MQYEHAVRWHIDWYRFLGLCMGMEKVNFIHT